MQTHVTTFLLYLNILDASTMTGAAGTSVEIRIVWIDIPADVNYQDRGLAALSSCVCTPKIIDTSQLNVLAEVMYGKDKTQF